MATVPRRAIPCSDCAEQRHKIIRNGVALVGEESVSVGHQGTFRLSCAIAVGSGELREVPEDGGETAKPVGSRPIGSLIGEPGRGHHHSRWGRPVPAKAMDATQKVRFALDSALEGTGFEPSVPL
jgi:hypothetical protein